MSEMQCDECLRLHVELARASLQKEELKQALAAMVTHPKLYPNAGDWRIAQAQKALLVAEGAVVEKPVDERACCICGGAGLRDIGHAPCVPVAEKRKEGS
jgi:hypothetical protein